ncbi:hypothetical protein DFH11DRAFT_1746830 [Phellopilus nigrolimitatus]|nr:hypothetical protein DFH11DRAFT_1746830 [Phellopilus nigrolimitatus]
MFRFRVLRFIRVPAEVVTPRTQGVRIYPRKLLRNLSDCVGGGPFQGIFRTKECHERAHSRWLPNYHPLIGSQKSVLTGIFWISSASMAVIWS